MKKRVNPALMNKLIAKQNTRLIRLCISSAVLVILGSCGGGLGGSGDGGTDKGPTTLNLPGFSDSPYQFRSVPNRLLVQFPGSLSVEDAPEGNTDSPYIKLGTTVTALIDEKVEIGLLQLLIDTNWDALIEHCSTTPADTSCSLSGQAFSTPYTLAMAAWEYQLRTSIEFERNGTKETLAEETLEPIEALVRSKIGSVLTINDGKLTQTPSQLLAFEFNATLDIGFGNTVYTIRWSEDKTKTFISIAKLSEGALQSLQSSTDSSDPAAGFINSVLYSISDGVNREEKQLNLKQIPHSTALEIESQFTEIGEFEKRDYYSLGTANSEGGYLSSELLSRDAADLIATKLVRESFNNQSFIDSTASCDLGPSEAICDADMQWNVETGEDPILSQFFLTPDELTLLESKLKPYNLSIAGVSDTTDTFIFIRRENLSISFTSAGLILTIPGLGTIDLTAGSSADPAEVGDALEENPDKISELSDSVLCRVNRALIDSQPGYRSFCAGTTEEIENALVIGESFRAGELLIEWQANALIKVIDN